MNLAALWPQAPTTDLHGTLTAGPDAGTGTSTRKPRPAECLEPDRRPHQPRARPLGYPAPAAGRAAGPGPLRSGRLDGEPGHGHRGPEPPRRQPGPARQLCARHRGSARLDPPAQPVARCPALRTGGVAPSGSVQAQMPSQASRRRGALDGRHSISRAHGHRTGECDRPAH